MDQEGLKTIVEDVSGMSLETIAKEAEAPDGSQHPSFNSSI